MEGARKIDTELLNRGHDVHVVSFDDPNSRFLDNYPVRVTALGPVPGAFRYTKKLIPWLRSHRQNYDAVIVNGLWQYHGYAVRQALRESDVPYYVFTHGMLDPWFKQKYPLKHLKKWLYWPWGEYRVLRDATAVLFTTEEERVQSRKSFWLYKANERVVTYGTSPAPVRNNLAEDFLAKWPELKDKRIILYLGRIHEKKGCDLLLDAFARVSKTRSDLHLVMAGPNKGDFAEKLAETAQTLGLSNQITWTGMLQGSEKWGAFYAAEVFCLPSHQENFGIAVAEAMSCATPVLISNKVNIWREIETDGAGFVAADDVDGTFDNLEKWLSLSHEDKERMSRSALKSFESRFTISKVVDSFLINVG